MKKALYVIGTGLMISGIAAVVYMLNRKKRNNVHHGYEDIEKEQSAISETLLPEEILHHEEQDMYVNSKSTVVENIHTRHEDAATIIRDSVETIRENVKVSEETNNQLDEISAEFDKMFTEE
jgi:hypothetical protein